MRHLPPAGGRSLRAGPRIRATWSSEIPQLKAKHDAAIATFPGLGHGDWAWAEPAFPLKKAKQRLTFVDLESAVGLAKWRAHVGMAHHNVQAGHMGHSSDLGVGQEVRARSRSLAPHSAGSRIPDTLAPSPYVSSRLSLSCREPRQIFEILSM